MKLLRRQPLVRWLSLSAMVAIVAAGSGAARADTDPVADDIDRIVETFRAKDPSAVTVLANMNPLRTDVLESRISRLMLGIPEPAVTEVPMPADELKQFAGDFVVTDAPISHRSVTVTLSYESGQLRAGRFPLRPVGGGRFMPAGDPSHEYIFSFENGRPMGLKVVRESRLIADARRE